MHRQFGEGQQGNERLLPGGLQGCPQHIVQHLNPLGQHAKKLCKAACAALMALVTLKVIFFS